MHRRQWIPLVLVMLLASCATDGGSSGTGITSVEGNVATIQRDGAMMAAALMAAPTTNLAGIAVTVEGTSAAAETDAGGRFVVRGTFEGPSTLRFGRAADAVTAQMTVFVPLGGTMTLHDVQLDVAAETAVADNQHAVFDALVQETDCAGHMLSLVSVSHEEGGYVYMVDLSTTFLHDGSGTAVDCAQLRAGERVHVEATSQPDGSFTNADVEVERG
jgi:hypothetical protein